MWENDEFKLYKIYEGDCTDDISDPEFPKGWTNFWRSDDVCATAYFYLDRPSTTLPGIQSRDVRDFNVKRLK